MAKNVITRGRAFNQSSFIDGEIEAETQRKIMAIDGAEDLGIRTACKIDGEFILVCDSDLNDDWIQELKEA